jgi:hypothetical protein
MVAFSKAVDAEEALEKKGAKVGSPRTKAAGRRWHVAMNADRRGTIALCRTIPTTTAGLAALANYAAEIYINEIHPDHRGAALLRSIARIQPCLRRAS